MQTKPLLRKKKTNTQNLYVKTTPTNTELPISDHSKPLRMPNTHYMSSFLALI